MDKHSEWVDLLSGITPLPIKNWRGLNEAAFLRAAEGGLPDENSEREVYGFIKSALNHRKELLADG